MRHMLRFLCRLMTACILLLSPRIALAFETEPVVEHGSAAIVCDEFGNVLYGLNEDEAMPMASITKVMTAMVALDSGIDLDEPIAFVYEEYPEGSQLAGYKDGDTPTFRELLQAMLVYSGNDAATNVAYAVAGSKEGFAELMNQKAEQIGLENTHFANPHGLEEEGHYSSASDLVKMGRYAMDHYPFIRQTVSRDSIVIVADGKEVKLESTDELMGRYLGLLGIKTGNTESGASFLGAARRNLVTLYSCVLCSDTEEGRFEDTVSLLDWGFGLYADKSLAHGDWLLRMAPWQDGFWLRCPVSAKRSVVGSVFCEGDVTYTTVMFKPNTLVRANSTYGTTVWNQSGRHVESVSYDAGCTQLVSAWSPVTMPLFEDVEGMVG